jgi:hypothetical protein
MEDIEYMNELDIFLWKKGWDIEYLGNDIVNKNSVDVYVVDKMKRKIFMNKFDLKHTFNDDTILNWIMEKIAEHRDNLINDILNEK